MNADAVNSLRKHLPSVFNPSALEVLPDDVYTKDAGVNDDVLNEIEGGVLEGLDLPPEDSLSPQRSGRPDIHSGFPEPPIGDIWSNDPEWEPILGKIRGKDGYPGAPEQPRTGMPQTPDALAFYLPFHRFPLHLWGIYLIAEGVQHLTTKFFRMGGGYLTPPEALRLARGFLFHHEAYHNAVEAFATRMEVAHRRRIYEAGVQLRYQTAPPMEHEEALATAYAMAKAPASVPASKRRFASTLLVHYVNSLRAPYGQGAQLFQSRATRDKTERTLQEGAIQLSIAGIPPMAEAVWKGGPYLMRPSLNRGNRFTYFVLRSSPLGRRLPLGTVYFVDRRKLLAKLRERLGGGSERPGGKHPMFVAPDGTRVPVPTGKTVDGGTVSNILKQLGIGERPQDFMFT